MKQPVGGNFQAILRSIRVLGLAALCLPLAGCGLTSAQRAAMRQLGSATSDFAACARSELIQSRQDVIEMNRLRVLLGDDAVAGLDGAFTLERTRARLRALDALDEYGQLLEVLLATSSGDRLQASVDTLVSTMNRLEETELEPVRAEALGKLMAFGGRFRVEQKRAQAAKAVIELAHPAVVKAIRLVERDFDPNDDLWTAGYRRTRLDLEGAAQDAQAEAGANPAAPQLARTARLVARENQLRFELVSGKILETAGQLRKAEETVRAALASGELGAGDVQAFRENVHELKTMTEILRPNWLTIQR